MTKSLHEMALHEVLHPTELNVEIIRVPGGWIYNNYSSLGNDGEYTVSSVFVPLNMEFLK